MMAYSFVTSASASTGAATNGTSLAVAIPGPGTTVVAGDLAIVFVLTGNGTSNPSFSNSGFTQVDLQNNTSGTGSSGATYSKILDASDITAGTITVTVGTATKLVALVSFERGPATSTPSGHLVAGTGAGAASTTVGAAGCPAVAIFNNDPVFDFRGAKSSANAASVTISGFSADTALSSAGTSASSSVNLGAVGARDVANKTVYPGNSATASVASAYVAASLSIGETDVVLGPVVATITLGAPAGTVTTVKNVSLGPVVSGFSIGAPTGSVSTTGGTSIGPVTPPTLTLSAPAGTVTAIRTVAVGPVTAPTFTVSAPAGTVTFPPQATRKLFVIGRRFVTYPYFIYKNGRWQ